MGRKRTVNLTCPPGLHPRPRGDKTYYYYITGTGADRQETPLGSDFALAMKRYCEYEVDGKEVLPTVLTFRYVAEKYRHKVIPTKAPRTRKDNAKELENLLRFFDNPPAPLESIRPLHIRQYLTWRDKAPVRANREKALFSHIWNFARDTGYTDLPNPCAGIKGHREDGRDYYVETDVFQAVYEEGCQTLKDALDLAYFVSQRPSDVLRYRESDIRDDTLPTRQGKTSTKLRVAIEEGLKELLKRIRARKSTMRVAALELIVTDRGQPVSIWNLRRMFDEARAAAAKKADEARKADVATLIRGFQYRDLRAKGGTDRADDEGILAAKDLLGHTTVRMTEHYVRNRRGKLIRPNKPIIEAHKVQTGPRSAS